MRILSIGYGNRSFEAFISLAIANAVTHIVDVRSVPYSNYQAEFRRESLTNLLPEASLRYVYLGDLLGAEAVRERPQDVALGVEKLIKAACAPGRILCLMCGCLLPDKCHRGAILGEKLMARGIEYIHIDGAGNLIPHEDLAIQLALF